MYGRLGALRCGLAVGAALHRGGTASGRHCIGKDRAYRIESNNARQRHWFARFRRRTCAVSKSVAMVKATMALFAFHHCNGGQLTPASVR